MAKFAGFKVSVKIKELEIHVEGDRQIGPDIANNVAEQISGIIKPTLLTDGTNGSQSGHPPTIDATPSGTLRRARKRGVKPAAASNGTAIEWQHDPSKWGTPLQQWTQVQKINWLLYVIEEEGIRNDGLRPVEMEDIYERKFKSAGLLTRTNIGRDLRKASDLFGELDGRWHLKQAGKDAAAKLVAEAKGGASN